MPNLSFPSVFYESFAVGSDSYSVQVKRRQPSIDHEQRVLFIDPDTPPDLLPVAVAKLVAQAWAERVSMFGKSLAGEWHKFSAAWDAIADAGELTCDDAGDVFASFTRLRKMGLRFSPTFILAMEQAAESALSGDSCFEDAYDVSDFEDDQERELSLLERQLLEPEKYSVDLCQKSDKSSAFGKFAAFPCPSLPTAERLTPLPVRVLPDWLRDEKPSRRQLLRQQLAQAEQRREQRIAAHAERVQRRMVIEVQQEREASRRRRAERRNRKPRLVPIWCVELQRKFDTKRAAARFLGCNESTIGMQMKRGPSHTVYGYHFERFDPSKHQAPQKLSA